MRNAVQLALWSCIQFGCAFGLSGFIAFPSAHVCAGYASSQPRFFRHPALMPGTLGRRETGERKRWTRMKIPTLTFMAFLAIACGARAAGGEHVPRGSGGETTAGDAGLQNFPCEGYWICGEDVPRIDLVPEADGCFLSGLPGRNLLSPDGTITADGTIVGVAVGSGARVHVSHPDGTQWLFCAGASGCRPPP